MEFAFLHVKINATAKIYETMKCASSKKKECCRTYFGSVHYPSSESTKNSSARKKWF
jgi:hypothetical protein